MHEGGQQWVEVEVDWYDWLGQALHREMLYSWEERLWEEHSKECHWEEAMSTHWGEFRHPTLLQVEHEVGQKVV